MTTIKKLIDLPYGDFPSITKLIDLPYGDFPSITKLVEMLYGDVPVVEKLINLSYGDLTQLRNKIELSYDLQKQLKALVNLNYHLIQGELRSLIDLYYDIQDTEQLRNLIDFIYSIVNGEGIEEITTLSVINENGYTLDPFHINVEKDENDPCIRIEIQSNREGDYEENPETTKIEITINADTYVVLVEEREISNTISMDGTEASNTYTLKMASPCLLLDAPYSTLVNEELTGMASAIAAYVAAKEISFDSYGIEWNIIDWYIGPDIFSANDLTPIAIIERLASAAGGIRQSKKDGTLEIRSEYPVDIPGYATESPEIYLTDQEDFYSVTSVTEKYEGNNNYLVSNEEVAEGGLDIQYESISPYSKEVRVFQIPWEGDTVDLNTSATSGVVISPNGITNLLIENEEVEIVDGEGTAEYAIYDLVSSHYADTDLGSVSFTEDKKLKTDTLTNSILFITYYTKYHTYLTTNDAAENVQFWPEIK